METIVLLFNVLGPFQQIKSWPQANMGEFNYKKTDTLPSIPLPCPIDSPMKGDWIGSPLNLKRLDTIWIALNTQAPICLKVV